MGSNNRMEMARAHKAQLPESRSVKAAGREVADCSPHPANPGILPVVGPRYGSIPLRRSGLSDPVWFLQSKSAQLLDPNHSWSCPPTMKFIALIHPANVGRAYGIGQTVCEAQSNAASSGFQLGDWVAIEISKKAYETISIHGPEAVHFSLPPHPATPE